MPHPARLLSAEPQPDADSLLGFTPVPVYHGDGVVVAPGYTARPFLPAGTPFCPPYSPSLEGGRNSGADQEAQVGHHHDGMHFFPLGEGEKRNRHGLLCLNHQSVDPAKLHPNGPTVEDGRRTDADEVRKEIAAHGVSIVEVERKEDGTWEVVRGPYNRRITAETPIATPDSRTLFINLQHPGEGSESNPVLTSHWPDGGTARPRSAVVVITKDDGGVVGT